MKFEAIERESVILDPRSNMEPKTIPCEIRKDPLTGRTCRISHFMPLKWEKPDFNQLVAGTDQFCPFCPDKVMTITPCFPEDIVPEGRMVLDDKVLFPNIAPYDSLSGCATFGDQHFIPMTEITSGHIVDTIRLALRFFHRVDQINHPDSIYHLINWNYMPASGSSIIHPHLQVFATAFAPLLLLEELTRAKMYFQEKGANYWDDLVQTEKANERRFLGQIGRTSWMTVYAPLGVAGDVMAVVDDIGCTLELTDDDISHLAQGLIRLMAAYDKMGIYNFNMNFFSGKRGDRHARFHLVFSPRTFFNQALGTPDVGALRHLYNESICMAFPEEINEMLKPEF